MNRLDKAFLPFAAEGNLAFFRQAADDFEYLFLFGFDFREAYRPLGFEVIA